MRETYSVAVNPFWRYAVALDHRPDLPAIPFFSLASALAMRDRVEQELPWTGGKVTLLRRAGWRKFELLDVDSLEKGED